MRILGFVLCFCLVTSYCCGQLNEVFVEDFYNNDNRWPPAKNSHINAIVANGRYLIEHKKDDQIWTLSQNIPFNTDADFTITVKIHHVAGGKKHTYGVLFGGLGAFDGHNLGKSQKAFSFDMVDKGHFAISEFVGGKLNTIYSGKSKAIKPMVAENILEIKQEGDQMYFLVNGKQLHKRKALKLHGYRVGFVLNQDTKLKVEYVKVYATQKEIDKSKFFYLDARDKGIQIIDETLLDTKLELVNGEINEDAKNRLVGVSNSRKECYILR